jgi:hypothetical protein
MSCDAGADGAREYAVLVRGGGRGSRLVHPPWLAGTAEVVDERSGLTIADVPYCRQSRSKQRSGIGERYIAARKHERANARGAQGQALKAPVADALIAGKYHPAFGTNKRKPDAVIGALGEVLCQSLDGCAGRGKRLSDRLAVKRLVEENC